jgi:two-component system, OmpR family, phosphate regulon response regulator OmpR
MWSDEKPHILIIEDDLRLQNLLATLLKRQECMINIASNVDEARQILALIQFDMIIMDVMLGAESGLDLTAEIRRGSLCSKDIPILMLSALSDTDHRITGLTTGADDYLGKPFEPEELILRLASLWRRVQLNPPQKGHTSFSLTEEKRVGGYTYDSLRGFLVKNIDQHNEEIISLTPQERIVLELLLDNKGQVVERDILQAALSSGSVSFEKEAVDEIKEETGTQNRSLDIYITRLRRKIEPDPKTPRFLMTVRGGGYKFL